MHDVRAGDRVALKAQIENGAFPDEYIVTFPSTEGNISGFVKAGNAVARIGDTLFLAGRVEEVSGQDLTLFIRGSFFTNSGFVKVKMDQIEKVFA